MLFACFITYYPVRVLEKVNKIILREIDGVPARDCFDGVWSGKARGLKLVPKTTVLCPSALCFIFLS